MARFGAEFVEISRVKTVALLRKSEKASKSSNHSTYVFQESPGDYL